MWKFLFGTILITIIGIGVFREPILKYLIEVPLANSLDQKIETESVEISPDFSKIVIRSIKIYNPPGYSSGIMADLPLVSLALDTKKLIFEGFIWIDQMIIQLDQLNLERNRAGKLNIDNLTGGGGQESEKPSKFHITELVLSLGAVSFDDDPETPGQKISIDFDLEDQKFSGIEDPSMLTQIILVKIFKSKFFNFMSEKFKARYIKPAGDKMRQAVSAGEAALIGESADDTGGSRIAGTVGGALTGAYAQTKQAITKGQEALTSTTQNILNSLESKE